MRIITTLLLATVFLVPPSKGQEVQKCCGTSNSTFLLGNTNYARHSQSLYLPDDLTEHGSGPITQLYFRYGSTGQDQGNTLGSLMIRLGQTAATAFVNGDVFFTDLDTVLMTPSYTIAPGTTGEWFAVQLQTPFDHNADQTLILDIWFETSAQTAFGTYGTPNDGRKLIAVDIAETTGSSTSTTWQDLGFDLEGATDIEEPGLGGLALFPNPAHDLVQLTWHQAAAGHAVLEVIDASGRIILQQQVASGTTSALLDAGALRPGLHVVRSRIEGKVHGSVAFVKE